MANVAKDFAQLISQSKSNKTGPYDTQATVKRVEGNTVWVSIPGGVDETPIDKTVNCTAGDKVQVRVSGGRAWITGNASAPPTDDTTAIKARTTANEAQVLAVDAKETADAVEGIATSASATAVTAKTIAEGVNEHFWHDNTGAHVTEVTQEEWNEPTDPNYHSGGNTLITTQGMAIRNGLTNLAEFGASGATIGVSGSQIAHLGYGPGNDSGGGTSDAPYYTLGVRTGTVGNYSVAEGNNVIASGPYSHAEGNQCEAIMTATHAEGNFSQAFNIASHAEGHYTIAQASASHAEGRVTETHGVGAHAEGQYSVAEGDSSHAQNYYTKASSDNQTALGKYNISDSADTYAVIVGNGTADNARSNALTVDWSGNVEAKGSITAEGHDSPIGYRPTRATGSYSLASGTSWTTVPSSGLARTTLSPGVWIIQAQAIFASNSTGWRALRIYDVTTSENIGRSGVTQPAVNGATTNLTTMAIISLTASNAFTLQITQNSGSARNVDLTFDAVRIA